MVLSVSGVSQGNPVGIRPPGLEEIVVALADAFCMVPVVGRPLHWQSGHYELWADLAAKVLHLRYRSGRPHAFRLTLAVVPGRPVMAIVRGQVSAQGHRDMLAADERLDGVILDALCQPLAGSLEPAFLGDLLEADNGGEGRHG